MMSGDEYLESNLRVGLGDPKLPGHGEHPIRLQFTISGRKWYSKIWHVLKTCFKKEEQFHFYLSRRDADVIAGAWEICNEVKQDGPDLPPGGTVS